MRDASLAQASAATSPASAYVPVFLLEVGLLVLALILALPMWGKSPVSAVLPSESSRNPTVDGAELITILGCKAGVSG